MRGAMKSFVCVAGAVVVFGNSTPVLADEVPDDMMMVSLPALEEQDEKLRVLEGEEKEATLAPPSVAASAEDVEDELDEDEEEDVDLEFMPGDGEADLPAEVMMWAARPESVLKKPFSEKRMLSQSPKTTSLLSADKRNLGAMYNNPEYVDGTISNLCDVSTGEMKFIAQSAIDATWRFYVQVNNNGGHKKPYMAVRFSNISNPNKSRGWHMGRKWSGLKTKYFNIGVSVKAWQPFMIRLICNRRRSKNLNVRGLGIIPYISGKQRKDLIGAGLFEVGYMGAR